ncbi:Casein kinase II regulatory subunit family protein [Tritrichomonas foetus]|uniref:Casein kinase II subunit beta n=1 Tax=Tritrichomonas foetus TaxID=1144522 RepID=A0A1J4JTB0_9EUKA|nr:Casein kinase II regulatory subunit family protein [Tritrichomonas foetus]|eukprot:OHT02307.1 Casein kinase II regulatory subunit family protein [Tritrichomonas foetus]
MAISRIPKRRSSHSLMTDTESSDDSEKLHKSWIASFLEQPSSDWFAEVPESFASDGFNTYGLSVDQSYAKSAFIQLLGSGQDSSDDSFDSDSEDEIEKTTEKIFGLIHSRYIFTPDGVHQMYLKYKCGIFGNCPRYKCGQQHLLPVGLSDHPGKETVKLYCPSCKQLYEADEMHQDLDGAFFSKSFPHYLLNEMKLKKLNANADPMLTSESLDGKFWR